MITHTYLLLFLVIFLFLPVDLFEALILLSALIVRFSGNSTPKEGAISCLST